MKFDRELVCTLAIIVNVIHVDVEVQAETCTLGDRSYLVGETWNPKLAPYGENSCINCTCLTGGDVKCNGIECPKPDCKEPRILKGRCCPTCENLDNLPPTVWKDDKRRVHTDYPGCEFHGLHYDDGDIFPSNKTAIKTKHINQCVLCACHRGDVICHLKTCLPSKKCRKTVKVNDDCCLKCEEAPIIEDFRAILSDTDTLNHTLEEGDCLLTTGRKKNGTTWKPVIGQYGEIHCIFCTCINGQINCSRLHCQEETEQKCNTPNMGLTNCCQQCSTETRPKAYTAREKTRCRQNTSDKNNNTNCVSKKKFSRNKRNRKKLVHGENGVHTQENIYSVRHRLCIYDKTQHLLYHTKKNNTESLSFDWQFQDTIEFVQWTVRKGRLQNIERRLVLKPGEHRNNITVNDILGAVQHNDVTKFFKELERIQQRCKKKCKRKILDKAIKNLKVQKLDLTKSCDIFKIP